MNLAEIRLSTVDDLEGRFVLLLVESDAVENLIREVDGF